MFAKRTEPGVSGRAKVERSGEQAAVGVKGTLALVAEEHLNKIKLI